jgi:hypothetical protein
MAITNKEMLESALKRINGRLGDTNGKLYHDNTGWYVIWIGCRYADNFSSHGIDIDRDRYTKFPRSVDAQERRIEHDD